MICLTCNANYHDYVEEDGNGGYNLKLATETCDKLVEACYPYLEARV